MTIRRVVPNLRSEQIHEIQDFYVKLLGFKVAKNMGWIVTLVAPQNPTAQISLIRQDATAPIHPDLSVEVANVDEVYAKALAQSLEIAYPLTNEP